MQEVQAGWYADPQVAGQIRYWDGAQWTEHVRPAPGWYPDPQQADHERYFDGSGWTDQVRFVPVLDGMFHSTTFRKNKEFRLLITSRELCWDEDVVRWDDVTGFDQVIHTQAGSVLSYEVKMPHPKPWGFFLAPQGRNDERTARAYGIVLEQARRMLTPRFATELLTAGENGAPIEFEKVVLSPAGFAKGKDDPIPWSEYAGWKVGGMTLEISRQKGDKVKKGIRVTTTMLGKWVVPVLVEEYARRYR